MTAELIGGPHDGAVIEMPVPFVCLQDATGENRYFLEDGQERLSEDEPRKYLFVANGQGIFGV